MKFTSVLIISLITVLSITTPSHSSLVGKENNILTENQRNDIQQAVDQISNQSISQSNGNNSSTNTNPSRLEQAIRQEQLLQEQDAEAYQHKLLFEYIYELVRRRHFNNETTPEELITGALKGMLRSLDPHSAYFTPEEAKKFKENLSGSFSGVGIVLGFEKNGDGSEKFPTVYRVIEGGPADVAGLKSGDIIIEVDGEPTELMDLELLVSKIRGETGTIVNFQIFRDGDKLFFDVERGVVKSELVLSEMFDNGIGYMHLRQFIQDATPEIKKAIDSFKESGELKGLILDLRYNPGGLLYTAIQIVDMFSDSGIAVSEKNNRSNEEIKFEVKEDTYISNDIPLIILINEKSASASEIVAGSLKQMGRAIVIGTRSYGKGSVQTQIPLHNGGILKLTTNRYYTHDGTSPHGIGIEPDIQIEYDPETVESRGGGKVRMDNQLRKAIEHLQMLIVESNSD